MAIICAWCKKIIKAGNGEASHGICEACEVKFLEQLKASK
jgi:hypothetical protein